MHAQQRRPFSFIFSRLLGSGPLAWKAEVLGKETTKKHNKRGNDTNLKTLVAKPEILKYIKEERAYLNKSQLALILNAE